MRLFLHDQMVRGQPDKRLDQQLDVFSTLFTLPHSGDNAICQHPHHRADGRWLDQVIACFKSATVCYMPQVASPKNSP